MIDMRGHLKYIILIISFTLLTLAAYGQTGKPDKQDSLRKAKALLQDARVKTDKKEIKMTIRNVDISSYPIIKLIVEAYNIYGQPLDSIQAKELTVLENGIEKQVISVEKISINERVPVDFCFVIDQTGSMQSYIDEMEKKIYGFTNTLRSRGIDYTLSLILFSDYVDEIYNPTSDVTEFLGWLRKVKAKGGGDAKENALKALDKATDDISYRPSANKVVVLITDAPYHQLGENGLGKTKHTTTTIIKKLVNNDIRVFGIVPPKLDEYKMIAGRTRGTTYDMDYPFQAILDNFSTQLTNLYALKYKTDEPAIPDSIDISIVDFKKEVLTQKTIPIVELGRKLIIENMLFKTGRANLPDKVKELDVLTEFMTNRKNVVVMIEGHTDNVGSYAVNDRLSLKRANSVKQYLVDRGISPLRIKTKGYGERRPIASNKTDWGRRLNRRTEVIIIAK